MINELVICVQILLILGFGWIALKMGKEALIAWICIQGILANLFVLKQIDFWGFSITCSDAFAIGSILGLNLVQEYYGKPAAKKALWCSFFVMAFYVVMTQIHLLFRANPFDTAAGAFQTLLTSSPRLLLASVGVFFITQQIDLRLFSWIQRKGAQFPLWMRSGIVLSVSQLIDTVLFSIFGLWGLVGALGDVILISYGAKLLVIASFSLLIPLMKPKEEYDAV